MSDTTRLTLPLIAAAQAQKHVTHNEAIMRLDGLVQMTALSYTTSAQPGSPSDGDLYLLPSGKTGSDWGGYSNYAVAHYYDGVWHQYHPNAGWLCFVQDTATLYYYTGSSWSAALLLPANNLSELSSPSTALANLKAAGQGTFKAYLGSDQTVTASTNVQVALDTAAIDPKSWFNTTTHRFVPTIAGYYWIAGATQVARTGTGSCKAELYKNGSRFASGSTMSAMQFAQSIVLSPVHLNGSTDYVELYVNSSSTNLMGDSNQQTNLCGFLALAD